MASERAKERAEEILGGSFVEHTEECQRAVLGGPGCTCGLEEEEELRDEIAAALDEARAEGAEDRTVQIIAALEDLNLRPQDGGPVYYATYEFGGEVKTVALQPKQIEPVFRALRDATGGYEKLQEWRKRVEAEAEQRGAELERWECHRIATATVSSGNGLGHTCWRTIASRIRGRGPMRGPEEGE